MENNRRITKLSNCVVVDVEKGETQPGLRDIYMQGGRIMALCAQGQEHPEADRVIEAGKNYVIPGMINTHCHNTYITPAIVSDGKTIQATKRCAEQQIAYNMKQCVEHGITTIRDALSDNLTKINRLRDAVTSGETVGPRIFASVLLSHAKGACIQPKSFIGKLLMRMVGVPILDYADSGTGVVLLPEKPSSEDLEMAVDEAVRRGADFVKYYNQHEKMLTYKPGAEVMTDQELSVAAARCRSRGLRTLMHLLNADAFSSGCSCGVDSLSHLPIDRKLTETEIDAFSASDAMIEPTLCLAYYYCWIHDETPYEHERLIKLSQYRYDNFHQVTDACWIPPLRDGVYRNFERAAERKFKTFGGLSMLPFFRYMDSFITTGFDNMVALLKSGCRHKISFGNDAGATQCSPATKEIEIDLLKMCCNEAGMSAQETNMFLVQVFTRNGAVALGKGDHLGCIQEGYCADLAVYRTNPLTDADVLKGKTVVTVVDGNVYETEST
jgi:imidazolonepropionase-like amidohydrolase